MENSERTEHLTMMGKKLILYGIVGTVFLLCLTLTFGDLLTPLQMLQIRLSIIGVGILFCLVIYFYIHRTLKHVEDNLEKEDPRKDVIIIFNGKEI